MEKAFDLFNSGDYEGALKLFEQALSDTPKEEWSAIHSNVGAVLMAMDDLPSAVAAFDEALKLDENNADSLLNRGIALNAMEKYEDALNSFNRALAQAPNHHSALCGKSQALAGLRSFDEAVDAADLACKADPTLALGFQDKAFGLLKARRFHESNQVYETALKLAGEDEETKRLFSIALVQEALDLEMEGDRDRALDLFHRANTLWPDSQSLFNEGLILLTKKRHDEGVNCLQRAIELDQEYFDANNALGTFYAQQDKFPESKMYLLRACELEPRAIEPLFNLGFVRLKGFRDVDGARKDWLHVLEIVPGEPHATEALRLLDEALRLAKERGSDGKQELDDAIKAIEKFTSCAAPVSSSEEGTATTPKLIMGEDGNVLGLSPEQADRIIAALDRSQNALDHDTNPATKKQLEEDCKQLAKDAEDAAAEANKAADALKQALANKDAAPVIAELGDNAMESALKAVNVASATAPVAFVATKAAPHAALDAAVGAVKSAAAAIEAAAQALLADPLNADVALQTTNAAIDALQNAKHALDKIAADSPELSSKAKQASADAANAIKRGNQVKKQCQDVKQSPSYQEARNALRKQNRGESSLDRLTRGNNGVNSVPFGQGLLKKTGRMEALLTGYQPPVLVTDNEGKLVGMTKSEGEAVLATLDALPNAKTQADKVKLAEALPAQLSAIAKDTTKATKDAAGGGKPVNVERAALLSAKTVNLAALGVEQAKGLVDSDAGAALDLCESAMDACVVATAAAEQIIKNDPLKADFALGIAQSALASAKAASELCNKIIGNSKDAAQVARAQRILANADKAISQANAATTSATTMKGSAAYLDALSKLRKVGDRQPAFRQSEPKALPFGQSQLRRTGRRLDQVGSGSGGFGMENMLANSIAKERGNFNQKYAQSSASVGAPFRSAADSKPKVIYKKPGPPPDGVEFPFAELKSPKCPEGVDPSNKEEYLSAAEFKTMFGKSKEEFKAFPAWRRAREKQQKGIF